MRLRFKLLGLVAVCALSVRGYATSFNVNITFDEFGHVKVTETPVGGGSTTTVGASSTTGGFDSMGTTLEYSIPSLSLNNTRSALILTDPNTNTVSDVVVFLGGNLFVYNNTDKFTLAADYTQPKEFPSGDLTPYSPSDPYGLAEDMILQNTSVAPPAFTTGIIGSEAGYHATAPSNYGATTYNAVVTKPYGSVGALDGAASATAGPSDSVSSSFTYEGLAAVSNGNPIGQEYQYQVPGGPSNSAFAAYPGYVANTTVNMTTIDFIDAVPLPSSAATLTALLGLVVGFAGYSRKLAKSQLSAA